MSIARTVTDSDFAEVVLGSALPVIVDFWAPWCGPCRAVAPIVDKLAAEHPETLVVKVNVDENPMVARQFGVMSIPHLMRFENGQPVNEMRGAAGKPVLEKLFVAA